MGFIHFDSGLSMSCIVERSRLVLDHSCTLYGLYALSCMLFGGIFSVVDLAPLVVLASMCLVTTHVGRFICMRSELLPIPLGAPATAPHYLGQLSLATARIRALLPFFTGAVAKMLQIIRRPSPDDKPEAILLTKMSSLALPSTPKK